MAQGSMIFQAVEKLNPSAFQKWKTRIRMELELRGALTALDQDCPSEGSEGFAEWKTADVKARAVIMSGLTDEQLTYVEEAKTAREMMANLTDVYAKLGGKHQGYLLKDLGRMNLTSKEDCEKHINECVQLLRDLELTGFKLDENQRVWIFLGTLDEDVFGPFSNEVFRRDTNRFKNVLGELRSYCTSFKHRECKDSNYKLQGKPQNKGQVICFRCEGKGHIAKECPTPENYPNSYPPKGRTKGRNNRREGRNAFQWNVSSRDPSPDRRPPQRSVVSQDPSTSSNLLLRDKLLSTNQSNPSSCSWIVDSGASSHSTSIEQFFHSLDKSTGKVVVASGETLDVAGKGKGRLRCKAGGRVIDTVVHDVLYVPGLQGNTLSVPQLDKKGFCVRFFNGKCTIRKDNNLVAQAFLQDGVYVLDLAQDKVMSAKGSSDEESMALWHRRLGHRDTNAILDLQRRKLATGIKVKSCDNQVGRCTVCIRGKGCRPSFPQRCEQRTTRPLELVHSDLCGPFQVPSFGGNRYLLTFVDDFSKFCVTYFLKEKSETHQMIKIYTAAVTSKFGRGPQALQTDNGGEYLSHLTKEFLEEKGITHRRTVTYTPEQNGVAERKNRSLLDMARCMLIDAKLPSEFWGEAANTATYIQNRLPTKGAAGGKTPFELWHGRPPSIEHLKVFGCKVFSHIPKEKRSKLDPKAEEGIFVGYSETPKGYRVADLNTGRVTVRHTLYFAENEKIEKRNTFFSKSPEPDKRFVLVPTYQEPAPEASSQAERELAEGTNSEANNPEEEESDQPEEVQEAGISTERDHLPAQEPRRSTRENRGVPPPRLSYSARLVEGHDPESWAEIERMPTTEAEKWKDAAREEMAALQKNKTWTLTELPPGKKAIGCKWVFKAKQGAGGEIERYKARLVAKGYSQKFGEDYDQTFAPVVRHSTIRLLLSVAASRGMQAKHLDVKTAFLHGEISEQIYMKQPPGFVDNERPHLVCRLQKGLYGLKQAARAWNEKLHQMLAQQNFKQGEADPCLYIKNSNGKWTYLLAYVDDLLVIYEDEREYQDLVEHLNKEVEIKELGDATFYLGIQIERDNEGNYLLSQRTKTVDLIESLGLRDTFPVATPMETEFFKQEKTELLPDNTKYREAIGKLLYLSTTTRPDIASAVGILSRKTHSPSQADWIGIQRVGRYLKGTLDFKLKLPAEDSPRLTVYTDSDWAEDPADRKSTSGHLFLYGGGAISWGSKKQTVVALSTTESELISASEACREVAWLCRLLSDMGIEEAKPVEVREDNQSCIKLTQSEGYNARTKHVDIKFHHVRDMSKQGVIALVYCPTGEMVADLLTKPLPRDRFQNLRGKMNLLDANARC